MSSLVGCHNISSEDIWPSHV